MKLDITSLLGESGDEATGSTAIARPQRWDRPFSDSMTDEMVDRILKIRPFSDIDQQRFPATATLRDILRNDARITKFKPGDIVVREGDYGSSAFFVIEGSVAVALQSLPENLLGRARPKRKSFFEAISQLWKNSKVPEKRDLSRHGGASELGARVTDQDDFRIFIQDFSVVLGKSKTAQLKAGEWFGEIAAMGRTPRTASVIADSDATLLEIRWQGLRDIRLRADEIKRHIDELYRKRSLLTHLRETPLFKHLPEGVIAEIGARTTFETFGNFEWFSSYQAVAKESAAKRLSTEPIIAREGDYPNGLILIRSGFARLSEQIGNGHRTISYLGKGQIYGLEEIAHNWRTGEQLSLQRSLRALGYVDVLVVPTKVVEEYVLKSLPSELLPPLLGKSGSKVGDGIEKSAEIDTGLLEFLVENRYINGTATMMIDMDRCTRCDDCVRACATTHDGNPRFLRHGKISDHYMIANACMHCVDPVCMIGCPTGAIHRHSVGGQVAINDATCIGCSTCANSCPYDNIRMVEIRDPQGKLIRDEKTHAPIFKATKCDLCSEQITGPACQNACPHDALKRVDMQNTSELAAWLNR